MGLFAKLFGKKKSEKNKKATADTVSKPEAEKNSPASASASEKPKKINNSPSPAAKKTAKQIKADDEAAEKISADKTSETVSVSGASGFFDIKKSKDGRYVFNLYAKNRVIIATSQIYSSAQSALGGANSVIANAKRASIEDKTVSNYEEKGFPKWEIYKDKAGQFRFRLCAPNGSCICHSQGYTTKASCKNGIESIIRTVDSAGIDKTYLKSE